MEAFVFPEHSEWTQEFAKMAKLDRLGKFQMINLIDWIRTVQDAFVRLNPGNGSYDVERPPARGLALTLGLTSLIAVLTPAEA